MSHDQLPGVAHEALHQLVVDGVGHQPFGGYGLSGVGSKAGGPDYLLQFLDPRVVTENTLRQGFAPSD